MGQEGILLGLVEAMDLIDEEDACLLYTSDAADE